MTYFQPISDAKDRVMATLIAGLEIEFGRGAGEALAHRFLDAEEADFAWDARVQERWLGSYEGGDDDDGDSYVELDRIAVPRLRRAAHAMRDDEFEPRLGRAGGKAAGKDAKRLGKYGARVNLSTWTNSPPSSRTSLNPRSRSGGRRGRNGSLQASRKSSGSWSSTVTLSEPNAGPLFAEESGDDDQASGTIYVLRSKSDHPLVVANREVLHKIGVTGGDVSRRIGAAKLDPTFLMADVEIVATYNLYNINRARLENLVHRIFDPARLEIEVKDRFGNPVIPREWFLVPLFAIREAVAKIMDGTITDFVYDPSTARLTSV